MAETTIAWCDFSFNPWMGCTKVSAACDHCYAEVQTARFKQVEWGPHAPRKRTSAANWKKPIKWNREAEASGTRPRVFCASLADVFDNHKSILSEWRTDLWALIKATPHLDWLLLTKRPQNIHKYLPDDWGNGYPNVWLGTTVEDQKEAERRISELLAIPAKFHFLSCEPLLGEVKLSQSYYDYLQGWNTEPECCGVPHEHYEEGDDGYPVLVGQDCCGSPNPIQVQTHKIDWVICGGESAPDAVRRDMNIEWARSLRDQCAAADVPFFFKQHSGKNQRDIKAKGHLLDGVEHYAYPETGDTYVKG